MILHIARKNRCCFGSVFDNMFVFTVIYSKMFNLAFYFMFIYNIYAESYYIYID